MSAADGTVVTAARCASCDAPLTGPFCSACGRSGRPDRLTMRGLWRSMVQRFVELDRRALHTLFRLLLRPGPTVHAFLGGRVDRLSDPFRLAVVLAAVATIASGWLGIFGNHGAAVVRFQIAEDIDHHVGDANAFFARYLNAFMLLSIPFVATVTRLFFRRARLNLAEHIVFATYALCIQTTLYLLLLAALPLFGADSTVRGVAVVLWGLGATAYFVYAATDFFRVGRFSGALRGLVAYALANFLYWIVAGVLLVAYAWLRTL